tara:strand:- start:2784 stop:3137 length:354 start_codon:yes stop_codon:yes gene_type:complete
VKKVNVMPNSWTHEQWDKVQIYLYHNDNKKLSEIASGVRVRDIIVRDILMKFAELGYTRKRKFVPIFDLTTISFTKKHKQAVRERRGLDWPSTLISPCGAMWNTTDAMIAHGQSHEC